MILIYDMKLFIRLLHYNKMKFKVILEGKQKAYSLLEMMLVFVILSLSVMIPLDYFSLDSFAFEREKTVAQYINTKADSMFFHTSRDFYNENCSSLYPIKINEKGNVNMAQTIYILNKEYIIGLGMGRLYEKKGIDSD